MTTIILKTRTKAPLAIVGIYTKPGKAPTAAIKGYAHARETGQIRTRAYRGAAAREGLKGCAYALLPVTEGKVVVEVAE